VRETESRYLRAGPAAAVALFFVVACARPVPARHEADAVVGDHQSIAPTGDAAPAAVPAPALPSVPAAPFVRMRWKKAELRLDYEGRSFRYAFDSSAASDDPRAWRQRPLVYAIEKAQTVKLLEKDGVVYLLVRIEGPSRSPQMAMHMCGAGSEEGLALFTFTRDREVKPPAFVLTQSCWSSIMEGDSSFHSSIEANLVGRLSYFAPASADAGAMETIDVHVAFDPEHPEAGLQFAERCRLEDATAPCPP
jgi:hypothetical protein